MRNRARPCYACTVSEYQKAVERIVETLVDRAESGNDACRHLLALYVNAAQSIMAISDAAGSQGVEHGAEDIRIIGMAAMVDSPALCNDVLVERLTRALATLSTPTSGKLLN